MGSIVFWTRKAYVLDLSDLVSSRYGSSPDVPRGPEGCEVLGAMLTRGSCRDFRSQTVSGELCLALCAAALASPTKSDLQQRDIVLVRDADTRINLCSLLSNETWVLHAPNLAVFCGNNRRQRIVHEMRGHAFANDHLDAFFNATVDAAIALSAFVTAAEAVGLGCCAISAVRNKAQAVSDLLDLPDYVFPVAGLAFGYPVATEPKVSLRLPLSVTVHKDEYREDDFRKVLMDYDKLRETVQPYRVQRNCAQFGTAVHYGWSEDKARQYALPERADFGAFVRKKGFNLD